MEDKTFTLSAELNDYRTYTLESLLREYRELSRTAWADRMFGHNARAWLRVAGRVLLDNGITHIPNMFKDIPITDQWHR